MIGEAYAREVVRPHEGVAVVLCLLHGLPGTHRGPLRQDPRGERDELLRSAALEETNRRKVVASLNIKKGRSQPKYK